MSDYQAVTAELDQGTPPDVLCATCPWSRPCIQPPTMTRQQIEQKIQAGVDGVDARTDPRAAQSAILGSLMAAVAYGGKDTAAQVCPVFALRLASPDGRRLADGLRGQMRDWTPSDGED